MLFATLSHRVVLLGNFQSAHNFVQRYHISFSIVHHLIHIDSFTSDVQVNEEM